ncbi:MAG: CDP-alcohol phosphatidyltransferase family protein [Sphingobacteriaceae bacterium]|nr:CDP-alcohol phosphatidyltransferase family protein [Sphingobacteriaceae bacterium]
MISVYQLKPRFQQLLLPILNQLHKKHITANKITLVAIVWSALIGGLLFMSPNHPIYLVFVALGLFIRMALNALDGMMARSFNQQSKLGEVLNELGDVVSDTIIFCALFSFSYASNMLVFLFIVLSIINEFSGVLAKLISGIRRYDGPMGKSDRALLIGLWCLLYFIFPSIGFAFNIVLFIAIILLLISTYKRLSNVL